MKLNVGITELTPGWNILLQQIGIPYTLIREGNITTPVLILSSRDVNKEMISAYVKDGGCIITEADIAEEILNIKTKKLYLKYIYSQSDDIFQVDGICDVYRVCKAADNANHLPNQNDVNTVLSVQMENGLAIVFPAGFTSRMTNQKCTRKNFYSEFGSIENNERVSLVSKGMIYHHILSAIKYLYHIKNLPFVTLWNFPNGYKNLFLFRIDTDFGTVNQLSELYQTLSKNNIQATWFVETKSSEKILNIFGDFKDQEISLHCFRHRNFNSVDKNLTNIKDGLNILNRAGIEPKGFAAPYGEWKIQLSKAIQAGGFEYSSEFCFAYDCLPLYTPSSKVLQIPIHPISIGRLKWGSHSSEEMLKYYYNVIDEKIKLQEPIILYTHPGEENFSLFDKIFEKINLLNTPAITFSRFNEWWKSRISFKWSSELNNGEVTVKAEDINPEIWIKVELPKNKSFLSPFNDINKKIEMDNIYLRKEFIKHPKELRNYSFRMFRHDLLSKYRKLKQ